MTTPDPAHLAMLGSMVLKSCRRDPLLLQRLPDPVADLVIAIDADQPIDLVPVAS